MRPGQTGTAIRSSLATGNEAKRVQRVRIGWGLVLAAAIMAGSLKAQDLRLIEPAAAKVQGTFDVRLDAPFDTTSMRFYVDGVQTSELTNSYAVATKTPAVWHTVISTSWFPAGWHTLRVVATTDRGELDVSRRVEFTTGSAADSLDGGWRFASADDLPLGAMESDHPAVAAVSYRDDAWRRVLAPNSIDAVDPHWMREQGLLGTYRRTFSVRPKTQELYLHTESCFWSCRYFVNGVEVGSSHGGYLPRHMRITSAVHPGENTLAVIVDSRASTLGVFNRLRYYYWNYTGLLQSIAVERLPRAAVTEFRAQGAANGDLTLYPTGENTKGAPVRAHAEIEVRDEQGAIVLREGHELTIPAAQQELEPVRLHLSKVNRWDLETPHLYTVRMTFGDGRTLEERTGFRDIMIHNGDLELNGKPVLGLQGFDRHGDYPGLGKSQPDGLADREIKLLHDKGYRIFRPAHYPTTKSELDAADKYGMLVLEEINVTGLTGKELSSPEVLAFAHDQLQRMIARDRSHPSVFAWSVGNENRTDQPGSDVYVQDVIGYGKTLDPTRPFTEVSAQLRHDICYRWMDFLAVNIYAGWYEPKFSDVVMELDALEKYAPGKPVVITEYGAEAVANRAGLGKGTEYYQALTVDQHNRLLSGRAHFIGKMYWTSTEFLVGPNWDGGNPHPVPPFHTKGLLTYYRQPKLAWRVMFSPLEMDALDPISVSGTLPQRRSVHITLRNREDHAVSGRFVVTPPTGASTSITEKPFTLAAKAETELVFDLTVTEQPTVRSGYGMVRAVVDEDTEALPVPLQIEAK